MHRLSELPDPWFFSTVLSEIDVRGGRFDLNSPRGTCYAAESLEGCLVEKLLRRPVKVVVGERLDELFHTVARSSSSLRTADLTSASANGFGLNAEVHSSVSYILPRRWAAALRAAGFRAVRHLLRGDNSQQLAGRALFGSDGLHSRAPIGVRTISRRPLDAGVAAGLLEGRGVPVLPIPHVVSCIDPPFGEV